MSTGSIRTGLVRACAALVFFTSATAASAGVIATDGFGDGDRNNDGTAEATVTNAADVGLPWYLAAGTSNVTFQAVDDSAGIGSGNALQLFNTGQNNRPAAARLANAVTLADGESLILRFDVRLLSATIVATGNPAAVDRAIRFGLYNDTLGDNAAGDQSSTSTMYNDDNGYNARVDAGNDASNSTSMDVTRDFEASVHSGILQATATNISTTSTNADDKLDDTLSHHFELKLTRSGTGMLVSLQQDNNPAISGTDATPSGFTFNEVAFGVRSSAAMDLRIDNVQVEHVVPEPASLGLLGFAAAGLFGRRKRR